MKAMMTSSALALILATTPALAEVTPDQVWDSINSYYEKSGFNLTTGSSETAGDTTTHENVIISMQDSGTTITVTVPELVMQKTGDGGVRITTPQTTQLLVAQKLPDAPEQDFEMTATMDAKDTDVTVSGTPEDMVYTVTAPTIIAALTGFTSADANLPFPVTLTLRDAKGDYRIRDGQLMEIAEQSSAKSIELAGKGEVDGAQLEFGLTGTDLQAQSQTKLPQDGSLTAEQMNAALKAGFSIDAALTLADMQGFLKASGTDTETNEPFDVDAKQTATGLSLGVKMSADGVSYQGGADATDVALVSGQLPMPINYTIKDAAFDMQLPIMAGDQPQPFKFAYSLGELTMADEIWAMFDPAAALPRDPMALDVDLTGNLKVTQDLFDPALMAMADSTMTDKDPSEMTEEELSEWMESQSQAAPMPFEPVDFTINHIGLTALGASVNGEGRFTMPQDIDSQMPVGTLDVTYTNIMSLLDNVEKLGFVPADQISSARMMLMMFARPMDGDANRMETKLELREDGSVFANGQQLQ